MHVCPDGEDGFLSAWDGSACNAESDDETLASLTELWFGGSALLRVDLMVVRVTETHLPLCSIHVDLRSDEITR